MFLNIPNPLQFIYFHPNSPLFTVRSRLCGLQEWRDFRHVARVCTMPCLFSPLPLAADTVALSLFYHAFSCFSCCRASRCRPRRLWRPALERIQPPPRVDVYACTGRRSSARCQQRHRDACRTAAVCRRPHACSSWVCGGCDCRWPAVPPSPARRCSRQPRAAAAPAQPRNPSRRLACQRRLCCCSPSSRHAQPSCHQPKYVPVCLCGRPSGTDPLFRAAVQFGATTLGVHSLRMRDVNIDLLGPVANVERDIRALLNLPAVLAAVGSSLSFPLTAQVDLYASGQAAETGNAITINETWSVVVRSPYDGVWWCVSVRACNPRKLTSSLVCSRKRCHGRAPAPDYRVAALVGDAPGERQGRRHAGA